MSVGVDVIVPLPRHSGALHVVRKSNYCQQVAHGRLSREEGRVASRTATPSAGGGRTLMGFIAGMSLSTFGFSRRPRGRKHKPMTVVAAEQKASAEDFSDFEFEDEPDQMLADELEWDFISDMFNEQTDSDGLLSYDDLKKISEIYDILQNGDLTEEELGELWEANVASRSFAKGSSGDTDCEKQGPEKDSIDLEQFRDLWFDIEEIFQEDDDDDVPEDFVDIPPATREAFELAVESGRPVLVDFFATWCGPCKLMAPEIAAVAETYKDEIVVLKIDSDEEEALSSKYDIAALPTILGFKNGSMEPCYRVEGMMTRDELGEAVEQKLLLPNDFQD